MLVILALIATAPLVLLVALGGRRLRESVSPREEAFAGPLPRTGLVVPVKGAPEGMAACLQALLQQDHPDYEVVFVVEDLADPAVPVITSVLEGADAPAKGRAQLVAAGISQGCGQKNWNQLAGLGALSPAVEILAFCDSTHMPRPDWLRKLVTPIVLGRAEASTSYHRVLPASRSLAAMGRTVSVLALHMMQEIPSITQPWGGAMAVARASFERLGVAGVWSRNVVDDVSLARILEDAGLRAEAVAGACMETPLSGETLGGWRAWLERQWQYLKFIFPGSWRAVGAVLYLQALLLLLSVAGAVSGLLGLVQGSVAAAAWTYLLVLAVLGLWARESHPAPGGRGGWLAAFFATLLMAAWSHARTLPARHIAWGGVCYEVGSKGEVLAVQREN